jgi:hypothetical protein
MREFVYKPALTKIAGLSVREALMKSNRGFNQRCPKYAGAGYGGK